MKRDMRKLWMVISFMLIGVVAMAQDKPKLYDPTADAQKQIEVAVAQAKAEGKHVWIQVGGNWCSWCIKLSKFYKNNEAVSQSMEENYVKVYLNYSKENKNEEVLAELGNPQRFGFPVIVILDDQGERIHTQNSALLEQDKGYNEGKVLGVLNGWSKSAVYSEAK